MNNFIQIKLNEIKLTSNSVVAVVGGVFFSERILDWTLRYVNSTADCVSLACLKRFI